jgi:TDG/mug DNA glycosylase family protein
MRSRVSSSHSAARSTAGRTWRHLRLPDRIDADVRVLFVGINPGERSARLGHHYAGHSNRFWTLVNAARLVPAQVGWEDDWRMPAWGYGLTNLVARPTSSAAELGPRDYEAGRRRLQATLRRVRPRIVALVGVTLYRVLFPGSPAAADRPVGLRDERLADAAVFVLPNPSGRNAAYSYAAMLAAFRELRRLDRAARD